MINPLFLKITFLGTDTSQDIPVLGSKHHVCLSQNTKDKRLRVSVMVELCNNIFVVDCGPDFRQQMLRANPKKIDAILFTHEHADHTAGIDDIRPYCFRQGDMPIYAHKRVIEQLKIRFKYIFATENRYPGAPNVKVNLIKNNLLRLIKSRLYQLKDFIINYKFSDLDLTSLLI